MQFYSTRQKIDALHFPFPETQRGFGIGDIKRMQNCIRVTKFALAIFIAPRRFSL